MNHIVQERILLAAVTVALGVCFSSPWIWARVTDLSGTRLTQAHRVFLEAYSNGRGNQPNKGSVLSVAGTHDFLVNDDSTGRCWHGWSSVAVGPNGSFVAAWADGRDGAADIYMQRYDSLAKPVGPNFIVNDDAGWNSHCFPSVAVDRHGNSAVVWEDDRNQRPGPVDSDIYCQRFDSSGTPVGPNSKVNGDTFQAYQGRPSVAMHSSGSFIVVWEDKRWFGPRSDIYLQRYDASGVPVDSNIRVVDDPGPFAQVSPSVAVSGAEDFVVVWRDERDLEYDIYCQLYDSTGTPAGSNFNVNDDSGPYYYQAWPSVAAAQSGAFIVCWADSCNGNADIYAQRYDPSGKRLGANFRVNDDPGPSDQANPSVACDSVGNFAVVWRDDRSGDYNIYIQDYDWRGRREGINVRVNDDPDTADQFNPAVSMDIFGGSAVVWPDARNGNYDIYLQRYDRIGETQGPNIRLNDDSASTMQQEPAVAVSARGDFVVVWCDERHGHYDVYFQRYDSTGTPEDSNSRVGTCPDPGYAVFPAVAMDSLGGFVLAWNDKCDSSSDIFAQIFDSSGSPTSPKLKANDDVGPSYDQSPAMAMNRSGNFVVTWLDKRAWNDIYCQRYDHTGTPLGSNFKVNDDVGFNYHGSPAVAMSEAGVFVVAWRDDRNGDNRIYVQRYGSNGLPLGSNFQVSEDRPNWSCWDHSVGIDAHGNFVITWEERDMLTPDEYDIYLQCFDSSGVMLGPNLKVNDDTGPSGQWDPSVTIDPEGGRFVVVWTDFRNPDGDPELMAQRFENGVPVGPNVQINEPDLFPANHQVTRTFSLACNHDLVVFAWNDNRRHKGWDIYARVLDWRLEGVEEAPAHVSERRPWAYPNPFSASVSIRGSSRELDIYDICGRLVGKTDKGLWDGRDFFGNEVHSGVYFLKAQGYRPLKVVRVR
jgi:hypothetical protein